MSSRQATFSIATDHREISHHFNIVQIEGLPLKRQVPGASRMAGRSSAGPIWECNDQHAKRCDTGNFSQPLLPRETLDKKYIIRKGRKITNENSVFGRTIDQRSRHH